jgi:hypothetical protein
LLRAAIRIGFNKAFWFYAQFWVEHTSSIQAEVNTMSNFFMIAGLVYLSLSFLVVLLAYCLCSMSGRSARIGRSQRITFQQTPWLAENQQLAAPAAREFGQQVAC